jgi:selenocysteine lyase/cysteine desulfurase
LLRELGLQNVAHHVRNLAQELIQGARNLGISIKTPLDSVGPLVVLQSIDVDKAIAHFAQQNIILSGRQNGLRISFHAYNTLDDVKQVLAVLKNCRDLMVGEAQPAQVSA